MLETFAPAKINLYLHVTGRRVDGYHYLDSLVAFANVGDRLILRPADTFHFTIDGTMAGDLGGQPSDDNLVVRAARILSEALRKPLDLQLSLTKNLPVASGIGGGSTDAAAALRLLAAHWKMPPDATLLTDIAAMLGQDVPCCLAAQTCYFRDIGNVTEPGPALPLTHVVLVNPRVALPTPSVFKARAGSFSSPRQLEKTPQNPEELAAMLAERSNDLTQAAIQLCPVIEEVLQAISVQQGCLLARMSGSGATCFGLFPDRSGAKQAAASILQSKPEWWVVPSFLPYAPDLPRQTAE